MALLSVIITSFNSEKTLAECLKSVQASSFTDYELIVIDDGSSDGTVDIVRKYPEIILLQEKNRTFMPHETEPSERRGEILSLLRMRTASLEKTDLKRSAKLLAKKERILF